MTKKNKLAWVVALVVIVAFIVAGIATINNANNTITPSAHTSSTSTHAAPSAAASIIDSAPVTRGKHRAKPSVAATSAASSSPTLVYVVRKYDNLTEIKNWYAKHYTVNALYHWNRNIVQHPNLIYPGQRLVVRPGNHLIHVVN